MEVDGWKFWFVTGSWFTMVLSTLSWISGNLVPILGWLVVLVLIVPPVLLWFVANRRTGYRFYRDGGHGWLEVPRTEVEASGADISFYSYYDPKTDMAYLEEDNDAMSFLLATGLLSAYGPTIHSSFPRSLPSYSDRETA